MEIKTLYGDYNARAEMMGTGARTGLYKHEETGGSDGCDMPGCQLCHE